MRRVLLPLLALAVTPLVVSQPLGAAEPFETNWVKDKKSVSLDPAKSYILVEAPAAAVITLFQIPTEEERKEDLAERAKAFAEAHADWEKDHAKWELRISRYKPGPYKVKPVEPVEPTEETFAWNAMELRKMVTLGPLGRFAKGEDFSLYLQEVPPGEYAYYGSIDLVGQGTCVCMGTVKFEVAPGKITTLRYDFAFMDKAGKFLEPPHEVPDGEDMDDVFVRQAMMLGDASPASRDPRLPADMFQAAEFEAMPTLPNWHGAVINRLQPIPGVLAYDRDKIIDLKAQTAQAGAQ